MQDYLKGLNERQQEAVLTTEGPLMIVAGAGSGKTKVLTTRIAHLMATGVDSFNILALTFTNKAAKEMKERIEQILGDNEARNLYIGTFHSVFARILRSEAPRLGYPNSLYNRISAAKNALVDYEEYRNDYYIQQEDMRSNRPAIAQVYEAYSKRC